MPGPLEGLLVLELVRMRPGAFCTMMLADMGADVIKIETPPLAPVKGAGFRAFTREEAKEAAFTGYNRNKRSVAVNLQSEEGREVLYRLSQKADVLLEAFRPGTMKKLGCDYERMSGINPRLIYCSLSGYGQTGPYRELAGHDINFTGMAGALHAIGESHRPPVLPLNFLADYAGAALHGVIGILLAIVAREKTGEGQYIDIAFMDTVISLISSSFATSLFLRGKVFERGALPTSGAYPYYSVYETKDGKYITIGCIEPWLWENFCRALDREDLIPYQIRPEHFGQEPDENYRAAKKQLQDIFLSRTRDEWFELLSRKGVCIGKVNSYDEVFQDEQALHRNMLAEVDHPIWGKIKQVGIPIKLSKTPGRIRSGGPFLGEHTDEILKGLGYSSDHIAELRKGHIIA